MPGPPPIVHPRARRPRFWLPISLLLLAALGASPAVAEGRFRIFGVGGPAYDTGFGGLGRRAAQMGGVAVATDMPFEPGSRLGVSAEVFPALVFRQTQDQLERAEPQRERQPAVALEALFYWDTAPVAGPVGLRLEAGTGLFYGWLGAIPPEGTKFNFMTQLGVALTWSASGNGRGRRLWAGYRWIHVSNLSLYQEDLNPGWSFHTVAIGVDWLE